MARLTDISVKALKPPDQGQKIHFDENLKGFGVRISQGGTKTYVLQHGRNRQLTTIGRAGIITLSEARTEAKRLLAERTLGRTRPRSVSFEEAKGEFLSQVEARRRPRTHADYSRILERFFRFGQLPLGDVTREEIERRLKRVTHSAPETHKAYVVIKIFFTWAERREYVQNSPCKALQPPSQPVVRARVLTDHELKAIWEHTDHYPFGTIVRLLMLTGQRKGEIGSLEWDWIQDDRIILPSRITKNGREHHFPTPPLVRDILKNTPKHNSPYVFQGRGGVFNGYSKAASRLRTNSKTEGWWLHDLRRTFATGLGNLGVPIHVTEKLLNHVTGSHGGIVGIYQRHEYWDEQVAALEAWERHVLGLIAR